MRLDWIGSNWIIPWSEQPSSRNEIGLNWKQLDRPLERATIFKKWDRYSKLHLQVCMMALPLSLVSLTLDFHYLLSQWPGLTVARFIISSLAWLINFNRLKRDPFRIRPDWPRSAIYLTRVWCNAECWDYDVLPSFYDDGRSRKLDGAAAIT